MLKVSGNFAGSLTYQGAWNANANVPFLQSSVGTNGFFYVVSVAGNTNLNGITSWNVGDWAAFEGNTWQKIEQGISVYSVNGQTGNVVLTAANVGAAANTVVISGTGLLSGSGNLTGNVTLSLYNVPVANVTGVGTMAVQNANNVNITGGSISGISYANISVSNVTITSGSIQNVTLANITTTGLVGYLYGNDSTGNVTASATIPVANVTGAVPNTVHVIAGTGMTGGGNLASNVTLNIGNTAVTPATYGGVGNTAQITVNQQGQITSASNVAVPTGTVTSVDTGIGLTGGPITSTGTISIANTVVTAGSYGGAASVGTFTVNQQGQLTAASNVTIAIPVSQVSGAVPNTIQVIAGTGLSGGGNLSTNVTLNVTANTVQQLVGVENNGVLVSTEPTINFIPSGYVTVSVADNPTGKTANVTFGTSGLGTMASQNANAVSITGGSINVTAVDQVSTVSSSATFATSSLPLVPEGYLEINLNGTVVKVPYYAV